MLVNKSGFIYEHDYFRLTQPHASFTSRRQ